MKKTMSLFGIGLLFFLFVSASDQRWEMQAEPEENMDLAEGKVISVSHTALNMPCEACFVYRFDNFQFWLASGQPEAHFYAPVFLPHGAIIKKVVVVARDNSSAQWMDVWLIRHNVLGNNVQYIAGSTTNGLPPSSQNLVLMDETITEPYVANHTCTYALFVSFSGGAGTDLTFKGVKIVLE